MSGKIVLISDDSDFFDFIKLKLELRNSDELFTLSFDEVPDKLDFLQTAVLIVNSENSTQKTLDLLKIFDSNTPIIVTAYNDDETFKKKCYREGMLDFIPLLTSDAEFRARMLPALGLLSLLEKNKQYRQILVKNKIITKNNEVFINYESVIDSTIAELKKEPVNAVFCAISPDDKNKYLINPNSIETFLINNIRKNDILIKYAYNKYYLIMKDTDINSAQKHWNKVSEKFQYKLYAGFTPIKKQTRQQLISESLNNLYESFSKNPGGIINEGFSNKERNVEFYTNFKMLRKELAQKLELMVNPVFYRVQQKYMNRLSNFKIEQYYNNNQGVFNISSRHSSASFVISSPGFTKINIDVTVKKDANENDTKRISFESNEFDANLLEDLLEQFVSEIAN